MGSTDLITEGPDKETIFKLFIKQESIAFETGRRLIRGTIESIKYENKSKSEFCIVIINYDEEYRVYYDSNSRKGIITYIDRNKRTLCFKCKIIRRPSYAYCPNCGTRFKDCPTYSFDNN